MTEKFGCVRATRVEIFGFGKQNESRENWRQLAIDCQRMTNRLWQIWLCHHANNGTANQIKKYLDDLDLWRKEKRGEKPKLKSKALEEPLTKSADSRSFYRILSQEFPGVNVRTRGLLQNAWQSLLTSRKAAKGSLSGWMSILLANESLPSFTRPLPIPFDKDNAKLIEKDGKFYVELRIERLADSGKSVVERCELILNRRKTASVRAIVKKIIEGEYVWKGSNLIYDRGKWFAALSYQMPIEKIDGLDADKILIVRPGRKSPWRYTIIKSNEQMTPSRRYGGDGLHIEYAKRAIERERASRMSHYRWSSHNQKGHGGSRARAVWTKLSSRWRDFVKRYNNEITKQITNLATKNKCGRVVYLQPKDSIRDSRFFAVCGMSDQSRLVWDFFQFGTMLQSKCERLGIDYENASNCLHSVR